MNDVTDDAEKLARRLEKMTGQKWAVMTITGPPEHMRTKGPKILALVRSEQNPRIMRAIVSCEIDGIERSFPVEIDVDPSPDASGFYSSSAHFEGARLLNGDAEPRASANRYADDVWGRGRSPKDAALDAVNAFMIIRTKFEAWVRDHPE